MAAATEAGAAEVVAPPPAQTVVVLDCCFSVKMESFLLYRLLLLLFVCFFRFKIESFC